MAEKRRRISSPKKVGEMDFVTRIEEETQAAKTRMGEAVLSLSTGSIVKLRDSIAGILSEQVTLWFEGQANLMSDMAVVLEEKTTENDNLREEVVMLRDKVKDLEARKGKDDIKASRTEMEAKIKEASLQVKIMDLDFGKEMKERKEIQDKAAEILKDKVRSDLKEKYEALCRKASRTVLARQTNKFKVGDKEIWTAPVLLGFHDRNDKWEMEDLLRKSKVHPAYHWPREMIEPVKHYRKMVRDSGISESDTYIRIRPSERDGKVKIRAETKKKDGAGKFSVYATWEVPPMEGPARLATKDWDTPVWAAKMAAQAEQPAAPSQ
jgi:hypothetical protein